MVTKKDRTLLGPYGFGPMEDFSFFLYYKAYLNFVVRFAWVSLATAWGHP
jgi:hypothetical protein